MTIIISKGSEKGTAIKEAEFSTEDELQEFLKNNPQSIPIRDIDPTAKLITLRKEFPLKDTKNTFWADVLAVDQNGGIYIIEAKLSKNQDKRNVIAQILDYGESMWSNFRHSENFSEFQSIVQEKLDTDLHQYLMREFEVDDDDASNIIFNIQKNLSSGNFTLILIMDGLEEHLKNTISFLNLKTSSSLAVYAVEMKKYELAGHTVVSPKLFGHELKEALTIRPRKTNHWRKEDFDNILNGNQNFDKKTKNAINKLILFTKDTMRPDWKEWNEYFGGTGSFPIFHGYLPNVNETQSLYQINSESGILGIKFWTLDEKPNLCQSFLKHCAESGFKDVKTNFDEGKKMMEIPKEDWIPKVDEFISILKKACSLN